MKRFTVLMIHRFMEWVAGYREGEIFVTNDDNVRFEAESRLDSCSNLGCQDRLGSLGISKDDVATLNVSFNIDQTKGLKFRGEYLHRQDTSTAYVYASE